MAANTSIVGNVTHPQRKDFGNEATTQFHRSTTTSNPMIHRIEPIFVVAVTLPPSPPLLVVASFSLAVDCQV